MALLWPHILFHLSHSGAEVTNRLFPRVFRGKVVLTTRWFWLSDADLDFWPPALSEDNFLLLQTTHLLSIRYSSHRNVVQGMSRCHATHRGEDPWLTAVLASAEYTAPAKALETGYKFFILFRKKWRFYCYPIHNTTWIWFELKCLLWTWGSTLVKPCYKMSFYTKGMRKFSIFDY